MNDPERQFWAGLENNAHDYLELADGVVIQIPATAAANVVVGTPVAARIWPADFEFPVDMVTPLLRRTLNDPLVSIRPSEIKEIVNVLFSAMLPFANLLAKI